jgi:hypothetical protein
MGIRSRLSKKIKYLYQDATNNARNKRSRTLSNVPCRTIRHDDGEALCLADSVDFTCDHRQHRWSSVSSALLYKDPRSLDSPGDRASCLYLRCGSYGKINSTGH